MTLRLLATQPAMQLPETLSGIHDALLRDAYDHSDHAEHMQAIREVAETARRLRELAAGCMRPRVLFDVAEQIEQAFWPLEFEAMNWDDDRAGRVAGNRLDNSRVWHPRDLGGV